MATADIIAGKNIAGPNPIQGIIEAAGANFFGEGTGIQTDLPFVTCTGFDEPWLIFAVMDALGVYTPPPPPTTPSNSTVGGSFIGSYLSISPVISASFVIIMIVRRRKKFSI